MNADANVDQTRSEAIAIVRLVDHFYWNLADSHVALWAADKSVTRACDLIEVLEATGNPDSDKDLDDLADAIRRLKQFEKDLALRTAAVMTAERVFRQVLGIPEADGRRPIPVTPPVQAPVAFTAQLSRRPYDQRTRRPRAEGVLSSAAREHDRALCAFDDNSPQPDRVEHLTVVPAHLAAYSVEHLILVYTHMYEPRSSCVKHWYAEFPVMPSPVFPQQVVHRKTRPLADAAIEAATRYRSFAEARRLRTAAEQRIDVKCANWEHGTITANTYLDAVQQFACLVVNEHHHLTAYNTALTFVSECKGTLLDDKDIIVDGRTIAPPA